MPILSVQRIECFELLPIHTKHTIYVFSVLLLKVITIHLIIFNWLFIITDIKHKDAYCWSVLGYIYSYPFKSNFEVKYERGRNNHHNYK